MGKINHSGIKIIFLIAAAFLIAVSILSYLRTKSLIEAGSSVDHTREVKSELENTFASLINVESNLRGYFLSKDSSFLLAYSAFKREINTHLNRVDVLVKDNPSQISNKVILRDLVNKRLDYMQSLLNAAAISSTFPQQWLEGKKIMDDVSAQISIMENEEDQLLRQRSELLSRETFITPLLTVFLIVGAVIILVAAYFRIMHELKTSDKLRSNVQEGENRIQAIFEAAPDAVITIDHRGFITNWNVEAETMFGWKKEEAIGKTLPDTIIPERYRKAHINGLNHFLKTGEGRVLNKPIEIHAIKKDNSEFPIELKISTSEAENKQPVFIGFVRDITSRRQNEELLKKQTSQLIEAQQLAHIGNWEWDVAANKIEWSDELYRIYGLTPQEFEASYENFLRYIHPDDREFANGIVQQAFKDHQPFNFIHKLIQPDGALRMVSSTGKVFTDSNGNTIRMAGTAQDVTIQHEFETKLKNQNLELVNMNKELESFAYISSHDLQEPLRKIQTFTTRLSADEQQGLSEKGKQYIIRIQDAALRMQTLIADLLAYSRTTSTEKIFEKTDLNKIIEEVKEDLKEDIASKHANIEATGFCEANIIQFQFRQLMHNLIGNALKFSNPDIPPHIKIKIEIEKGNDVRTQNFVSLSPQKEYCHISVSDNGIGFEPHYKERIFEMFQRLNDKTKYAGTGIGLAIVKKIVDNHEGIITASSEVNKGATFDIYIPES